MYLIPAGMSQNTTHRIWVGMLNAYPSQIWGMPHGTKHSSSLLQQKGCPKAGHPFAYHLWILLHPSLLSEYFFFHASSSFCPSSLAYNFWISGARNRAKESMMDCGNSISYGFWWFSWLAIVYCPNSKTLLAQLSPSHTPFRRCTAAKYRSHTQKGNRSFQNLRKFS